MILASSRVLFLLSYASAVYKSLILLSLLKNSFYASSSFLCFYLSICSYCLILFWSAVLFLLSFYSSSCKKPISFSVNFIFSAALKKSSCFLLASYTFFWSYFYNFAIVPSFTVLFLLSLSISYLRALISLSKEVFLAFYPFNILIFSAIKYSSFLIVFSSALLFLLSFYSSFLKYLIYWSSD